MRRGSKNEANKKAVTTAGGEEEEDRIGVLPDPILQHVLSFLPSCQAVRTCVLAPRWRHQWKSVPALRVDPLDFRSSQRICVNELLRLRDRAPLRECDIRSDVDDGIDLPQLISYALSCQARVLKVEGLLDYLSDAPLISEQLVQLSLHNVKLQPRFLDFSSCPKLEDVGIYGSKIIAETIVFQSSLRRLAIVECYFKLDTRTRISCPGLISLELYDFLGWPPVLEHMPSLVTTFIRLHIASKDFCVNNYYGNCNGPSQECYCHVATVHTGDSVLFDGLSDATNLELLTVDPIVFTFRKDLQTRPSFGKLKSLLLNDWCSAAKFDALVYFLQHSPVLEKLTLQLRMRPESMSEMDRSCHQRDQFLASKHLKVVGVRYHEDDVLALQKVLKILITCGVPSKIIKIQSFSSYRYSQSFSFEQDDDKYFSNLGYSSWRH